MIVTTMTQAQITNTLKNIRVGNVLRIFYRNAIGEQEGMEVRISHFSFGRDGAPTVVYLENNWELYLEEEKKRDGNARWVFGETDDDNEEAYIVTSVELKIGKQHCHHHPRR